MQVILLENISKLGKIGDLVKVKNGYARNFLLKKNKALNIKENIELVNKNKSELTKKIQKQKLQKVNKIKKKKLKFIRQLKKTVICTQQLTKRNIKNNI